MAVAVAAVLVVGEHSLVFGIKVSEHGGLHCVV